MQTTGFWGLYVWRLGSFHYDSMNEEDIRQFVYHAAAQQAERVFTVFEPVMCNEKTIEKVRQFYISSEKCKTDTNLKRFLDPTWCWENWGGFQKS
jgi:hypothetical protein